VEAVLLTVGPPAVSAIHPLYFKLLVLPATIATTLAMVEAAMIDAG
jgi:hypothetical protein